MYQSRGNLSMRKIGRVNLDEEKVTQYNHLPLQSELYLKESCLLRCLCSHICCMQKYKSSISRFSVNSSESTRTVNGRGPRFFHSLWLPSVLTLCQCEKIGHIFNGIHALYVWEGHWQAGMPFEKLLVFEVLRNRSICLGIAVPANLFNYLARNLADYGLLHVQGSWTTLLI